LATAYTRHPNPPITTRPYTSPSPKPPLNKLSFNTAIENTNTTTRNNDVGSRQHHWTKGSSLALQGLPSPALQRLPSPAHLSPSMPLAHLLIGLLISSSEKYRLPRTPVNKGKYGPGGGNARRTARNTSGPFFVSALWAVPAPEQSRRRAYASFSDAIAIHNRPRWIRWRGSSCRHQ
jgi:hypothetical protein